MSESPPAIFLSYASQDAAAAERIAAALREAGVEVWFDKNELAGGDAWDAKIRQQIKECTLFVPIISANTQARAEGYFRLEWKLAADRTHLMADDHPFLFPVVSDETTDAAARVPDRFRERQWMRLDYSSPEAIAARLAQVLAGDATPTASTSGSRPAIAPAATPSAPDSDWKKWLWIGVPAAVIPLTFAFWLVIDRLYDPLDLRSDEKVAQVEPISEVDRLLEQARESFYHHNANRHNFTLAERLLERAHELAPDSAEVMGARSVLHYLMVNRGYDKDSEHLQMAEELSAQALQLNPEEPEALFTQGLLLGQSGRDSKSARRLLERALAGQIDNVKIIIELARNHVAMGEIEAGMKLLMEAADQFPANPEIPYYAGLFAYFTHQPELSNQWCDRSLAIEPFWRALIIRAMSGLYISGDPDSMTPWLDQVPEDRQRDLRVMLARGQELRYRRDGPAWRNLLRLINTDYIEDNFFSGPKSMLLARAYELEGKSDRAQTAWQSAELELRQHISERGENTEKRTHLALALAAQGKRTEAMAFADNLFDDVHNTGYEPYRLSRLAIVFARLADAPRAVELLKEALTDSGFGAYSVAMLRRDPDWDPIRDTPEFQAMLVDAPDIDPTSPISTNSASKSELMFADTSAIAAATAEASAKEEPATHSSLLATANIPAKSIAVLPFEFLSAEADDAFFGDGVHDDVISNLAKIRNLKVISRTSTLAYRDTAQRNLKTIASELGVATILEGSVRRANNRVRVSAKLIDARTDHLVWTESYDGELTDIFALQSQLARQIASALEVELTGSEQKLIESRPTENQEAYDLYLRARAMQQDQGEFGTVADFENIISVYEKALALDPEFALAYVQLTQMHSMLYWYGFLDPSAARAEKIKNAVDAAVRLDPDAPETHLALGTYYYRIEHNWEKALEEFYQAEIGLPNDALLQTLIGFSLRRLGRWLESVERIEKAVSLNPGDLNAVANYTVYLTVLRRWESARQANDKALNYFPDDRILLHNKARIDFALDGDQVAFAKAIGELEPVVFDPAGVTTKYESALWRGDYDEAHLALEQLGEGRIWENYGNVISNPASFFHAYLSFLQGDMDSSQHWANQAMSYYRTQDWNPRQQPWVDMRVAQLKAWTGESAEAIQTGRELLTTRSAQDSAEAVQFNNWYGMILISVGEYEEALVLLHDMLTGPTTLSAHELRIDPLWSRLRDLPEFEQILQNAQPL